MSISSACTGDRDGTDTVPGRPQSVQPPHIWSVVALFAVFAMVALYPIWVVQIPGLGDYLNHLARMHVLATFDRSEALHTVYRLHWQAIPYQAMDIAFIALRHLAPIYDAGRIFVAICIVLPALSVAILHFAVHRRLSLVPLATFLFVYNFLLSWGFLEYLPALCLAVMLFAGWIASNDLVANGRWPRWLRTALFGLLSLMLYFAHAFAFGAYCLSVFVYELVRAWRAGFDRWRAFALDWLAAAAQALPAILVALSVPLDRADISGTTMIFGDLSARFAALKSPVWFYGGRLDILTGGLALSVFVLGLLSGRLRLAASLWPVALVVGLAAACIPSIALGAYNLDHYLPLLVVMLLISATSTTARMGRLLGCAVLGGLLALTVLRSVGIARDLQAVDGQIAEIRQVVAELPRGSRLLVVENDPGSDSRRAGPWQATYRAQMVAVIDRDAFVPFLTMYRAFTGLSAVRPAPALISSSMANAHPLHVSDLVHGLGRKDDPTDGESGPQGRSTYWDGWENKFDYVLLQHFGAQTEALPSNLQQLASSPVATLYRIAKTANPRSPP